MVTFTCSSCGDSLRKNALEKHAFRCKFSVVTCIDCFQEFTRSSYVSHNQCMTENERYQGKLYAGKGSENKGQKKQDNWLQNIQDYVSSGKAGPVASQVQKLLSYPNIPRKKNKFINFVNNCMAIRKPEDVERMWTVIVEANHKEEQQQGNGTKSQSNGTKRQIPADELLVREESDKKDKKRMLVETSEQIDDESDVHPDSTDVPDHQKTDVSDSVAADVTGSLPDEKDDMSQSGEHKFSWKKTIKKLMRDSGNGQMHLKDLKRQAYALYKSNTSKGSRIAKEEAYQKILKYASKSGSLQVCDDVVSLIVSDVQ